MSTEVRTMIRSVRHAAVCALAMFVASGGGAPLDAQQPESYARSSAGTRQLTLGGGLSIKLLLEASNLGSPELEVAEITFPVGADAPAGHRHGSTEIFYVVEGVLGHVVNGTEHRLAPGMVGVVKPGDAVIHRVLSDVPVKAVVLWVPGGEADRIAPAERWTPLPGAGGT
jgi:quercetin dioxygenase-like cupin family protein